MINLTKIISPEPIYIRVALTPDAAKNPEAIKFALDKRKIALELANHLLENGFIFEHGPQMDFESDLINYRFVLHAYKRQEKLP